LVADSGLQQTESSGRPRILIVGYGDLGAAVGDALVVDDCSVFGLRRSECLPVDDVAMLAGDVARPDTLAGLASVDPHILVYCVAATEQSDENYRSHYVDGLRNVLMALAAATSLRHVFFVSSTRVYGQVSEGLLNESDPAIPSDFGGERLLQAEQLLTNLPCGHTALRLSGIYGPGRNRLLKLAATPGNWPQQNTWSNRIHRDDAAAFIVFLIRRVLGHQPVDDCYIVTDNHPAPQLEVLHWLASLMGVDVAGIFIPTPNGGKRLNNAHMLAGGFRLRYPDYREGYAAQMP
jgi:nucleoside-diphosphate-sugar epimerase